MPDKNLAVEIAVQTIILLIGLSASIITFTSTFAQAGKAKSIGAWEKWSWAFMGVSIVSGISALLKIIGNADAGEFKVFEAWTCTFAMVQIGAFAVGLLFLVIMAVKK